MSRRIRIDRLDIDLRGIDPAVAETVVPQLREALVREFGRGQTTGVLKSAARIDAGRVTGEGGAGAIANRIAARVAASAREE